MEMWMKRQRKGARCFFHIKKFLAYHSLHFHLFKIIKVPFYHLFKIIISANAHKIQPFICFPTSTCVASSLEIIIFVTVL